MAALPSKISKVTTHVLQEMKLKGEKIAMLTAYDYSIARILDDANIDVILVGDSASNVMAGHRTTSQRPHTRIDESRETHIYY